MIYTARVMKLALPLLALSVTAFADTPVQSTRLEISVTKKGFEPESITVPAAKPVTLVFTRKTQATCTKEIVLDVAGKKIERALPLDTPVEIAVTFPKAGKLSYACGMDMNKGVIVVQ
jgi:plastocyanin domain-containing protein